MYETPPVQPKALPSPLEGMLDMTQAETPKNIITKLGLEHKGITPASETKLGDDIHWFNDPETGSTLTMQGKRVTTESIVKHVEKSRKNFKVWKPLKQGGQP